MRLETALRLVDFAARRVDIGVRYGVGTWPGLTAEKLMDEEIYPVCSSALLRSGQPLREPGDLKRVTLIHDLSMDGHAGFPTWGMWLRRMKVTGVMTSRGLKINNSAAVLQAAVEGRGVALARSVMARDDLAAGRVVRLFPDLQFASELAYYVVYRPESAGLPRLVAFRDWLMREAAASDQAARGRLPGGHRRQTTTATRPGT